MKALLELNDGTLLVLDAITSISSILEDFDTNKFYFEIVCGGVVFIEDSWSKDDLCKVRNQITREVGISA